MVLARTACVNQSIQKAFLRADMISYPVVLLLVLPGSVATKLLNGSKRLSSQES